MRSPDVTGLFTDACEYRHLGHPTYLAEFLYSETTHWSVLKWAHGDGGNIAAHDGSVRWRRNQIYGSGYSNAGKNWPSAYATARWQTINLLLSQ